MTLKERITEDMKAAMRAKETQRLSTIRLLLAALKQKEVDERVVLTDADVLSIIEKLVKQRRDSISQYLAAKRQDLADVETYELGLLQSYMPAQLTSEDILSEVNGAIAESGASTAKDMGKVMNLLRERLAGRADMSKVSAMVKEKLTG
jgi:uncharacterized protein YqeY